jgi:hypothetical protein
MIVSDWIMDELEQDNTSKVILATEPCNQHAISLFGLQADISTCGFWPSDLENPYESMLFILSPAI